MSIYNYLEVTAPCPHCGVVSTLNAEFRFGLRELTSYRVGDQLTWEGKGVRTPTHRPENGNFAGEAYAECPACGRDYWLNVRVEHDVIISYEVDADRPGYVKPDGAGEADA
ncbi:hypothetical protein Lesp02_23540 [Lentzea sp. NBRC 105346]|uniref:hypothetical protein n=1 Tax=Lentzea sp. NBRC 105346 TaxID=3032205 RepID=UPI0024A09307|nr:hypothetical protein [Lentzea sp. NBRC 105346]GLZ30164.1 hypothetical protein Lesp02_23540 [Lentzea sp. NBRC 105346]